MNPGGGVASLFGFRLPLYTQDLDMYGTDGTELGTVSTSMNTLDILGIDATPFTVTGGEYADGEFADGVTAGLPAEGTVYSVTDLFGLTNIYQAIPDIDGGAATISDVLATPVGNMDLSWMFSGFDATAAFDPGDILAGLDFSDLGAL